MSDASPIACRLEFVDHGSCVSLYGLDGQARLDVAFLPCHRHRLLAFDLSVLQRDSREIEVRESAAAWPFLQLLNMKADRQVSTPLAVLRLDALTPQHASNR
jgi:hypothetical protein